MDCQNDCQNGGPNGGQNGGQNGGRNGGQNCGQIFDYNLTTLALKNLTFFFLQCVTSVSDKTERLNKLRVALLIQLLLGAFCCPVPQTALS